MYSHQIGLIWVCSPIWYTIYPPKLPSPIYPQIAKYDLPSNHQVQFTPPIVNFQHIFLTTTSCFASQSSFLRKNNKRSSHLRMKHQKARMRYRKHRTTMKFRSLLLICYASFFSQPWNNCEERMIAMHVTVPSIYCKQLDKI